MKRIILILAGLCVFTAQASLYLYDGFDYTADTRLGANAASGGSGGWYTAGSNPSPTNRAESLTYSGLDSTGGKVELAGYRVGASGSSPLKLWGYPAVENQNTNMFASFLVNVASIGTSQSNNVTPFFTLRTSKASLVISNNATVSGNFNIGILSGSSSAVQVWDTNGGNGYAPNTTYFVVFSYTNNASETWSDQLWVNPASFADVTATTASFAGSSTTNNAISFANANGVTDPDQRAQIYVDELRVGTTWNDVFVIPEPATVGMVSFGGLITLMLRRIQKS